MSEWLEFSRFEKCALMFALPLLPTIIQETDFTHSYEKMNYATWSFAKSNQLTGSVHVRGISDLNITTWSLLVASPALSYLLLYVCALSMTSTRPCHQLKTLKPCL